MSLPETYKAIVPDENKLPLYKEFPLPKPSANQVLIKVSFAPINPTDLMRMRGFYSLHTSLIGSEGSGVVAAVGENLKVPYKVGDRVHITDSTWGQYMLANSEDISPILQDDLSFEDAASHFVNPATVYYMGVLAERGNHKAAIHTAGASALGKMLIRHYEEKGIKLINIVRKEEQIEELLKEGADYVLNSQSPDFEAKLKELAEKENATIAFDAIAGDFTAKVMKCQPAKSHIYAYGALSGSPILTGLNRVELMKGKVLKVLFVPNFMREVTEKGQALETTNAFHSLLPTTFKTNIHKIYNVEDIKEAIEYYEKNSSKGKILLKFN